MKRKKLFNSLLLSGMLLCFLQGKTQDSFAFRASLDTIEKAGFYRIILTPGIIARCKEDLSDLRILDGHGQFTSYVLKSDFPSLDGESFIEFPVLPGDSAGEVKMSNWSGGAIHSLLVFINNNSVWRNWTLSGSDDGKKWFVIREHIQVEPRVSGNTDHTIETIDFPASSYRYFRITQEDKGVLPLRIYRAGVRAHHAGSRRYRQTPAPAISQKDSSNHHSYVTLTFDEPYLVEYLDLDIKGPKLYKRKARILVRETPYRDEWLSIDPASHTFEIPSIKTRTITLDIDNEDNAPLVIGKVETSQLERYLLTWLEPGKYHLLAGSLQAQTPRYDLKYFVDTVSREPAEIVPGILEAVSSPAMAPVAASDHSGVWLWSIILVVLAFLVFFSLKMLKAIPGDQQKENKQ
ncbi:MAG: hypothetical protein J0H74_20045 [Chitinophagaceae bacterium]|nr:hypothetical protein [Chitinophagaceae bacterium]